MKQLLLVASFCLVFLRPTSSTGDICDLCACAFQDDPERPSSVTCSCNDEKGEVHIRSGEPRLREAVRLKVAGCGRVVLHSGAFSGGSLRHASIERVGRLELRKEALRGAALYTLDLEGVQDISFEKGSFTGGTADTLTVVRSNIQDLPPLGAYLRSVRDELTLSNVTIDNVQTSALHLILTHSNSELCLENVKIHNIEPGAISIEANRIEILSSGFGPYPSGMRLVGRHSAHICKNYIVQKKPNDFFDIYSPYINLTGNTFALLLESFGDSIKSRKFGKLITSKNIIDDAVIVIV